MNWPFCIPIPVRRTLGASLLGAVALAWTGARAQAAEASGGKAIGIGVRGTYELGIDGLYDFDKHGDTVGYLDLSVGYYLFENIGVGLEMLNGTTRTGQRDTAGIFGEYNLGNDSGFVPFAGGGAGHMDPPTNSDGKGATLYKGYLGVKIAATRRVGLAFTLKNEFASHPVLGNLGERSRANRELDLSLRFYF